MYYKSSGKMSPMALAYFLLACLVIFPLLGLIYAYAIWYIPFIYIKFLLAAGFGFAIGWVSKVLVVEKGKVRSTSKALLLATLGALVAYYFHWVVWLDLLTNAQDGNDYFAVSNIKIGEVISMAMQPLGVFSLLGFVNEFGTWGFGDSAVSGTFLTVIWLIEFLIIMFFAVTMSLGTASQPFCENTNQWFNKKNIGPFDYIRDTAAIVSKLEASDESFLSDLAKKAETELNQSIFTIYDSKDNESYLSIENQIAKVEDGKLSYDPKSVIEYIKVSDELVGKIKAILKQ